MAANPFAGLSKNQRIAVAIGGAAVAGFIAWKHFHPSPSAATATTTAPDAAGDSTLGFTSTGNAGGYGYATPITSGGAAAAPPTGQTPSDWIQAAETGLVNDLGYDPGTVQAAFAVWVSGGQLTAAQAAIIHAAVTEFPGGPAYPIRLAPSGGTGGGGTGGSGTGGGTHAKPPAQAPGLSVTPHRRYADFGWGKVTGATGYHLLVTGAGGRGTGTSHFDQVIQATHVEKLPLAPGAYVAKVAAVNAAGAGPQASRKFTVTK